MLLSRKESFATPRAVRQSPRNDAGGADEGDIRKLS
jgi:hypothetical protein